MNEINLRSLDLNLLVALDVLLDECHVSRSAERLNLSQSAMSHMLSRLRATFDDELLVRGPNGYEKTTRARDVEAPLKEALSHVRRVFQNNAFDPKTYDGSFNISTLAYGESVIIPRLMKIISKEAPGARINVVHRPNRPNEHILSDDADILFGAFFEELGPNLRFEALFEDKYVCVMHASHPLANETLTLENYLNFPHCVINSSPFVDSPVDDALKKLGHTRQVTRTSPHLAASIFALNDTLLLQAMPQRMAHLSNAMELVEKDLPFEVETIGFGQIWHAKNHNDPAHQWFRSKISLSCQQSVRDK